MSKIAEEEPHFCLLSNNARMPMLGLGTTHSGGYNHDTVVYALGHCKYRLIDTAKRYGVEKYLGRALKDSGIDRSEFFLTTKLMPRDYASVRESFFGSLERLDTEYLDMYSLHWPTTDKKLMEDTWRQIELIFDEGLVRSIGVSNFEDDQITHLLETASVIPHANQCEFNPYIQQERTRSLCEESRIQFQGYCPLAKGALLEEPVIQKWAKTLGVSPAQVLIKWSLQKGVNSIPKSNHKERVLENSQVFHFQLPDGAMGEIDALQEGNSHRRCINRSKIMSESFEPGFKPDGYKLAKNRNNVFPKNIN